VGLHREATDARFELLGSIGQLLDAVPHRLGASRRLAGVPCEDLERLDDRIGVAVLLFRGLEDRVHAVGHPFDRARHMTALSRLLGRRDLHLARELTHLLDALE
jgi:hypothetical protein